MTDDSLFTTNHLLRNRAVCGLTSRTWWSIPGLSKDSVPRFRPSACAAWMRAYPRMVTVNASEGGGGREPGVGFCPCDVEPLTRVKDVARDPPAPAGA